MDNKNIQVRLIEVAFNNIKSVSSGRIVFPLEENIDKNGRNNIFGIYGPNGSGKTALIDVLKILKNILCGFKINNDILKIISKNSRQASACYTFLINSNSKKYEVEYSVVFTKTIFNNEIKAKIESENLKVKNLNDNSYQKHVIGFNYNSPDNLARIIVPSEDYKTITKSFNSASGFLQIYFECIANNVSGIFSRKVINYLKEYKELPFFEYIDIVDQLVLFGPFNLYVIDQVDSNNQTLNLIVRNQKDTNLSAIDGKLNMNVSVLDDESFAEYKNSIEIANGVMEKIIPGLSVKTANEHPVNLPNGKKGKAFQLVSVRNNIMIPFSCESNGIRSIFSILSLIVAAYNNPYICVAIDELDSGVFEHLLGKLINIYAESGKGLVIFTSHNLRPLEMLKTSNIYFTSNSKDLYKNAVKPRDGVNKRNEYLRSISLQRNDSLLSDNVIESELRFSLRKNIYGK